jgi:hypothetical protein
VRICGFTGCVPSEILGECRFSIGCMKTRPDD